MPKWHTDYARDGDGYRITCPYCKATTTKPLLSEAVKAGLDHEGRCTVRAATEGAE